jgi:hypothetical protein
MTRALILALAALVSTPAIAAEQTRIYAPDGRSLGTIVPTSPGSVRTYDAQGRSTGTSTTTGNTTTFYGPGGAVTGTTTRPLRSGR